MDDLISRKDAIDVVETIGFDFSDSDLSAVELEEVCEAIGEVRQEWLQRIKRLPSAQPNIHPDGTLIINVPDLDTVQRVLVSSGKRCKVFYLDEE